LLVLALLLSTVPGALAQEAVSDDEVNAVAKELYCPVCESIPLDVCGTQACRDWRGEIRAQLANGATEQEIKDYFVARYGDRVLASPRTEGFPLLAWVLPVVAVVVGGIGFGIFMTRIRKQPSVALAVVSAESNRPPDSDDYTARIERELRGDAN
jgi:cytochrome c-type biogenesis protein CcmH